MNTQHSEKVSKSLPVLLHSNYLLKDTISLFKAVALRIFIKLTLSVKLMRKRIMYLSVITLSVSKLMSSSGSGQTAVIPDIPCNRSVLATSSP